MNYDYLIVGAGLFGSVFAEQMTRKGKKCLVIDRRSHIGGNVYTENIDGINVHRYGAHIFHTNSKIAWDYVNRFARFNSFINSPIADYNGQRYHMPFNMNTFTELWNDVKTPEDAKKRILEQTLGYQPGNAHNLEEKAISLVGYEIYEKLIRGYTEKQWGRSCKELPAFIIERIPLRFTFDNNYFNDKYQGIPEGGYTQMVRKMLEGVDVILETSYSDIAKSKSICAKKTIYTGAIDEYFSYSLGQLEYRTLRFETEEIYIPDYQGNAVINYTDRETPYTRIIEHKHFEFGKQDKTIITKEYPENYSLGKERYYPVNNSDNNNLYNQYKKLASIKTDTIFCGRLGGYRYYDMDQTVLSAIQLSKVC